MKSNLTVRWVALVSAVCFLIAAFSKLWGMVLTSIFYYQGLHLNVYANRVSGDLHELNILNHYIGMLTIGNGMPEFHYIIWVIFVLALGSLVVAALPSKRNSIVVFVVQLVLLIVLASDFIYRLYQYGHDFAPDAAIKVSPFTPEVWGNYQLANFHVVTSPGIGAFILIIGFLLMFAIVWMYPQRASLKIAIEARKQGS